MVHCWHEHKMTPRDRDVRGNARSFAAQWFFGHLNQDLLPLLQPILYVELPWPRCLNLLLVQFGVLVNLLVAGHYFFYFVQIVVYIAYVQKCRLL